MHPHARDPESWKRLVLRSMPKPAWLGDDAPHGDIVLSSRARVMRNLRGYRFVHHADTDEVMQVMRRVLQAAAESGLGLEAYKGLTNAERDYLVGYRLVSPEFEWAMPGRALLIDEGRTLSLMVNEEDHLRVQSLTAGWSIENCENLAYDCVRRMGRLEFAFSPDYGHLAASPYNTGHGRRLSAMFHLIGLANAKRLPDVIKALADRGIAVRGLFGESSRAVGAYAQVSVLNVDRREFVGACEYLIREEREARKTLGRDSLAEKARQARDFAISSRRTSLADALRILAWVRWASIAEIPGFDLSPRDADAVLTAFEPTHSHGEEQAGIERSEFLKSLLSQ
jgi:protein arginine kinase